MSAVATASLAETPHQHVGVNRPNLVQVGTIVWLSSELMFFAGLFAIYFTIRAVRPDLWGTQPEKLDVPYSAVNTVNLVLSSVWCQMGVFAAERFQPRTQANRWWKIWTREHGLWTWGMREWYVLTYAAGALFVAWTVVLAGVGLTVPEFPYNKRGQMAVILVSLVLYGVFKRRDWI